MKLENDKKIEKKSKDKLGIYVSFEFSKAWRGWIAPKREYSPEAAGAMLAFMDFPPGLQQELVKLAASSNIEKARSQAKTLVSKAILDQELHRFYESLGPEGKARMLEDAKRSEDKNSGKE